MRDSSSRTSLLQLTAAERILLVQDIWDSIVEHPEALEISEEHRQILDARLEACRQNPNAGSSWEQVKDRILKRQ
jgi:putative addiction module component (TIGR02574 family)